MGNVLGGMNKMGDPEDAKGKVPNLLTTTFGVETPRCFCVTRGHKCRNFSPTGVHFNDKSMEAILVKVNTALNDL